MPPESILVVWVGGPLDGTQQADQKTAVEGYRGKTTVCGGIAYKQSALYKFDDHIADDGRLYLRFVRVIPRRTRT